MGDFDYLVKASRKWGAGELGAASTLEQAVTKLNPKAKQAMYAAANKGLIARRTWDGCAFNAAGVEVSDGTIYIASYSTAAQVFDLPETVVHKFITVWDDIVATDEDATNKLKEAILKAGLFTEANESSGRRILRETVYRSYETRQREEFEALVEGLDLDTDESELVVDMKEVAELLSV